ncbi:conserved uncharacterized protein [Apostichopus japonicus]|uniref:Conserved uncharacterized protein n=1 Tax=Stichopus japonicus TaxID=307972 RepID=A0A2G8JRQ3_STIJA|nr:conserved uncharacterized protein [Apostichopus japonicus]
MEERKYKTRTLAFVHSFSEFAGGEVRIVVYSPFYNVVFDLINMLFSILLCLTSILVSTANAEDVPAIVYRRVDSLYIRIYDDRYTGSYRDVSIWRPQSLQYGYYPLGDVAVASHQQPTTSSILARDYSGDALRAPSGFTEVWNDRGSGGTFDVRILRMDPPVGYVCLGHVAVIGYNNLPDRNVYRCVKSDYVTLGRYELIWKDVGSGADRDVSLLSNRVSTANTYGLDANTFTSLATHATPTDAPYLLDGRKVKNIIDFNDQTADYALKLYEISDLDEIWNDKWSGARRDFSVWRTRGPANTYSLGDIARGNYDRPPVGYVVKARRNTALSAPYDFIQIWNDRGSGAYWDGAFYRPLCAPGFRALGHVAMRNHNQKPDRNFIRCVNETLTVQGDWQYVWDDTSSGADVDVGVGDRLLSQTGKAFPPYDHKILDNQPSTIARTVVINSGTTTQKTTRTLEYSYEESYTWNNAAGGEVEVTTEVSAKVPFFGDGQVSLSVTASYSHEWGGSTTVTKTDSVGVQVEVQRCSSKSAIITGTRYSIDVPYVARLITVYEDGTQGIRDNYHGIFRGVEVNEIRVQYEPDIPIDGCRVDASIGISFQNICNVHFSACNAKHLKPVHFENKMV